jgi:hypothetical protein
VRLVLGPGEAPDGVYTLTIRLTDEATMLRRLEGQLPISLARNDAKTVTVSFKKGER